MKIITLNTWTEIQTEFNWFNPVSNDIGGYNRFRDFYLFRGQRDSEWDVLSTLDRSGLTDSIENFEFEFKQKLNLFDNNNPKDMSNLELYSTMRHFNVPSPLVDFSFSPYIALFFAFESFLEDNIGLLSKELFDKKLKDYKSKYAAIYSLNHFVANQLDQQKKEVNYEKFLFNSEKYFDEFFKSEMEGLRPFLPSSLNKRINAQQGVFVCKSIGNKKTIANIFESSTLKRDFLVKYLIPQKLFPEILYELNKMNINKSTLFPDLDGLGSYVGFKEKIRVTNGYMNRIIAPPQN